MKREKKRPKVIQNYVFLQSSHR